MGDKIVNGVYETGAVLVSVAVAVRICLFLFEWLDEVYCDMRREMGKHRRGSKRRKFSMTFGKSKESSRP